MVFKYVNIRMSWLVTPHLLREKMTSASDFFVGTCGFALMYVFTYSMCVPITVGHIRIYFNSVFECVCVPTVFMFTSALLAVDYTPEGPAAVQPLQMCLASLSD